jgi:hypothetical protein
MPKQTAVEWLFDQYKLIGMLTTAQVEKAKEMEKKQIMDAYHEGTTEFYSAVEYYIETYGK